MLFLIYHLNMSRWLGSTPTSNLGGQRFLPASAPEVLTVTVHYQNRGISPALKKALAEDLGKKTSLSMQSVPSLSETQACQRRFRRGGEASGAFIRSQNLKWGCWSPAQP